MMYSEYPIEAVGTLMRRVFWWMTVGLVATGLTAFGINLAPALQHAFLAKPFIIFILFLAQIGLVIYLNAGLRSMSAGTAIMAYTLYALITGVTFSLLFLVFTLPSLAVTFFICAGMFASMALYGAFTRSDLSGMGTYLFMGLIGIILASFINMFVHSSATGFVISIIGVIIFTLLTAYDVQRIKRLGMTLIADEEDMTKVSIVCALQLYLDFVNLFLYLLNFLGQKKIK